MALPLAEELAAEIRTVNPLKRPRDQAGVRSIGRKAALNRPAARIGAIATQPAASRFQRKPRDISPNSTSDPRDRDVLICIKSELGPLAVARLPLFGNFSYSAIFYTC
jgi:hypothetical protein